MSAALYPPADHSSQWFADAFPGSTADAVDRLVLHTTEGAGWPDYQGGAIAPNWTARPILTRTGWHLDWRQHYPANMASRALVNAPGGVETNRAHAVQVELVGTCTPGGPGIYWPGADPQLLADLGAFVGWVHTQWGLMLDAAPVWVAPSVPGDRQRFTGAQWLAFRGICGHEHVPENDHRDPGALPITRVLAFASADLPAPTPQEAPVTIDAADRASLVADITASLAEALEGIRAVHPVLVDPGTGSAKLPDGRAIDALPTVVGEIQHEQRLQAQTLAQQGQTLATIAAGLQTILDHVREVLAALPHQ